MQPSYNLQLNSNLISVCFCTLLGWGVLSTTTGCNSLPTRDLTEDGAIAKTVGFITAAAPEEAGPSHDRNWRPDLAVLPYAEISSDRVHLHNIRDCEYRGEEDYDVRHYDRQILLDDVVSIDFIVVPFREAPAIAHTMLSFGLRDGEHIVFSVEARLEQGENYSLIPSASGQYELICVVGTERDLIRLRTDVRDVDVYLYPIKATPEQARKVFVAGIERINELAERPEYYDLLKNNCTTNIVGMINSLKQGYIPSDVRILLPGHSDRLAYELGLLAVYGPFEVVKQASKINLVAKLNSDSEDFSRAIRRY